LKRVVLDASVAVKWFLPPEQEPLAAEAAALSREYSAGKATLIVPDIFWAEVGNFFWKSVRMERCTPEIARAAIEALRERAFPTTASAVLIDSAFDIAVAFQRTVYDCLYIALAVASAGQFVTADERLANAAAARLPVKSLGAI
jgi:predicted nucleic acid-binding protein